MQVPGVRLYPRDERITRSSFYRFIFAIEPEAFAGAGNERIVEALEAEGIPAEIQYPPMSRYDLFQPSLSRLPVAVEYADRLDPANMSFPVAEKRGAARGRLPQREHLPGRPAGRPGRHRRPRQGPSHAASEL